MKKAKEQMLDSYDFSGKRGVRGKYAKAFKQGYTVRVYDGDKVVSDELFAAIEPDVRAVFPDSKSINNALRKLISIVPAKRQVARTPSK